MLSSLNYSKFLCLLPRRASCHSDLNYCCQYFSHKKCNALHTLKIYSTCHLYDPFLHFINIMRQLLSSSKELIMPDILTSSANAINALSSFKLKPLVCTVNRNGCRIKFCETAQTTSTNHTKHWHFQMTTGCKRILVSQSKPRTTTCNCPEL